jgi:DNA-binding MarR family transcriptional regulator
MSARVLRAGLSMAQLHILLRLHRNDGMTMSQLAEMMGVSLSNATGLVDRIEERGFVERQRVPEDRRVVRIQVTPAGARLLEQVDALSDELLRSVLERVDRSELPAVGAAFAALRTGLASALGDDGAPASDHPHPASR